MSEGRRQLVTFLTMNRETALYINFKGYLDLDTVADISWTTSQHGVVAMIQDNNSRDSGSNPHLAMLQMRSC